MYWISYCRLPLEKTEKLLHDNINFTRAGTLFSFTAVSPGHIINAQEICSIKVCDQSSSPVSI